MKKLQGLSIGECSALTNESLPVVCKTFRTMDSLDISNNRFGNCDFSPLIQCKNLKQLVLNGIPVTDKQMKELGKVKSLKRIYFQGAKFSDAGLKELYGLKGLKLVTMLDCPKITKAGLKELSRNVPKKCQLISPLMASSLPGIEDVDTYLDMVK